MKKKPESFPLYYRVIPSVLGDIGIIWVKRNKPLIINIILPEKEVGTLTLIDEKYPDASEDSHTKINAVCDTIVRYLDGEPVRFSLQLLDMDRCYDFQKRVLLKTAEIPRGRVITYGGLAEKIDAPCASRAVGTALARNPFPLILPCHRVVKALGYPGQFGGGAEMKKGLLEMEGVLFDSRSRIERRFFW